jgi:chromosomal replication initiator protein
VARPAAALQSKDGASESQSQSIGGTRPASGPRTAPQQALGRTQAGGFEGSPLDPRYTFESFVIGASNRMAHAGATQVAETVLSDVRNFNPLYIHASVGLGKTHLLHAIAWDVKQRAPHAQVLYLTAERFRYQFVEALRSSDPLSFKEKFRSIDILLIDDLEFLHGQQTEQEFDHIINSLLDGGRQVVVASARAPNHIEKLNERMRSRLQRGLVTELGALDHELRLRVLEKRMQEKRQIDPTFEIGRDVLELLADRLTDSGRELEGAITRLHATWQYMRTPIRLDIAETVVRDLVQGIEPRRIKIEDILKIVSRHFGVSKGDILSQRRHRSVVWPRQIGMYLAKQLTSRSLPEIGRRFGNRDHTTVLHAIRKIDNEITNSARLKDEIEELKKQLGN